MPSKHINMMDIDVFGGHQHQCSRSAAVMANLMSSKHINAFGGRLMCLEDINISVHVRQPPFKQPFRLGMPTCTLMLMSSKHINEQLMCLEDTD
jgi:hypothetical protein